MIIGEEVAAREKPPNPPLVPPLAVDWRERPESDSREPANIYLELMPLRLHCELLLARLRLDLGDLEIANRLLKEAEARMARCVNLLPWLYVQFCVLKLQWRRLDLRNRNVSMTPMPDDP